MTPTTFPTPSAEVRAEALARARELASGLFPHQVEGVAFLLGRRRAILADDMGLGKTRQAITALTAAAPSGPWLVVAPASVKRNWEREILAARPGDRVTILPASAALEAGCTGWVVINYDILAKHVELLETLPWAGLIFDEAHYLKNHTSRRSQLARRLVAKAPDAFLYALTGTPLTNRPRDLFPLLQLIGHPMGRSFLSFAKRYCAAYHNGFGWVTDGASNLEELRIQLHGIMVRRTKAEVLELPPKLRTWLPVAVPEGTGRKETRRVLETLIAGALAWAAGGRTPGQDRARLLADITRARLQIAKAKAATTIEFVQGVVDQGEKAIVFSAFDEPVRKIAGHFGDAALLFTGSTPSAQRQKLVDRFQKDESVRVFVANLVAGGVGLNLTAARQVVFNDLDWVPANHWQAEDRAYRIGQAGAVNVTYFAAEGTVDDFVAHSLRVKAALIDAVVEGKGEMPAGENLLQELEAMVRTLSPSLADLSDTESGEDPVDRLLREATAALAAKDAAPEARRIRSALGDLSEEAIRALARALSGPVTTRYRATSSSKPGQFYVLDVDGADVSCSCPGFEYRGACSHARSLKAALAKGESLPEGIQPEAA